VLVKLSQMLDQWLALLPMPYLKIIEKTPSYSPWTGPPLRAFSAVLVVGLNLCQGSKGTSDFRGKVA
jgi:hypothetical protein